MPKPLLINGSWVPSRSPRTREIRNPATLEVIDVVPDADAGDVDAAVQAATTASLASTTGGTVTYNNGASGVGGRDTAIELDSLQVKKV
mgnify:CR=1 FL=1